MTNKHDHLSTVVLHRSATPVETLIGSINGPLKPFSISGKNFNYDERSFDILFISFHVMMNMKLLTLLIEFMVHCG